MKIDSSNITMASQHSYSKTTTTTESLRAWVGDKPNFNAPQNDDSSSSSRVSISEAARGLIEQARAALAESQANNKNDKLETKQVNNIEDDLEALKKDPKIKLLITIVEALTGRKVNLFDAKELATADNDIDAEKLEQVRNAQQKEGWGLEYDYHESVKEVESTSYTAQGIVKTADGKTLNFTVDLQMSRSFESETNISIRAGDGIPKDPLVINFDGTAAELSGKKFSFDIDADGTKENISFVSSASGFLALDKDGNGKIDDGSELFGALSGDGFADLAVYDDDGNGWIDENDAIFAKLLIWTKDHDGNDSLRSLADHGVGALYLGNAATDFNLNDSNNVQHGQIRSTGVYLNENGTVGTMQQIDLFA